MEVVGCGCETGSYLSLSIVITFIYSSHPITSSLCNRSSQWEFTSGVSHDIQVVYA